MSRLWQPKGIRTPAGVYLPPVAGGDDFSLISGQRFDTEGKDAANSRGVVVGAGASPNVKATTFTELIASTAFDADGIIIGLNSINEDTAWLVDIGIGAAGSEQVLIPDLHHFCRTTPIAYFPFPISVPAGSRISARAQADTNSRFQRITATMLAGGFLPSSPLSRVTAYGADSSDSGGEQIDPGVVGNTKGAYSELSAATDNEIRSLVLAIGGQGNTIRVTGFWLVDIAVGAGGAEQPVIIDLPLTSEFISDNVEPYSIGPIPISIPAGSRLSAAAQCNITDPTDRTFDLVAYGVD